MIGEIATVYNVHSKLCASNNLSRVLSAITIHTKWVILKNISLKATFLKISSDISNLSIMATLRIHETKIKGRAETKTHHVTGNPMPVWIDIQQVYFCSTVSEALQTF